MRTLPCLVLAALLLAACGPGPDYYLLPPPAPAASQASPVGSIVVADVNLPAYAEAIEIASLSGPETIALDKGALWADTPRRAITRHLAGALDARLAARVGTEPWPGFDSPGLRVEVVVDRLIGSPGGGLDFAGQYALVSASGTVTAFDRFAIAIPPQGDGFAALLSAHARAIDALADRIAASIAGRRLSS
jgi:uncharacterized lipoprotein YmbA